MMKILWICLFFSFQTNASDLQKLRNDYANNLSRNLRASISPILPEHRYSLSVSFDVREKVVEYRSSKSVKKKSHSTKAPDIVRRPGFKANNIRNSDRSQSNTDELYDYTRDIEIANVSVFLVLDSKSPSEVKETIVQMLKVRLDNSFGKKASLEVRDYDFTSSIERQNEVTRSEQLHKRLFNLAYIVVAMLLLAFALKMLRPRDPNDQKITSQEEEQEAKQDTVDSKRLRVSLRNLAKDFFDFHLTDLALSRSFMNSLLEDEKSLMACAFKESKYSSDLIKLHDLDDRNAHDWSKFEVLDVESMIWKIGDFRKAKELKLNRPFGVLETLSIPELKNIASGDSEKFAFVMSFVGDEVGAKLLEQCSTGDKSKLVETLLKSKIDGGEKFDELNREIQKRYEESKGSFDFDSEMQSNALKKVMNNDKNISRTLTDLKKFGVNIPSEFASYALTFEDLIQQHKDRFVEVVIGLENSEMASLLDGLDEGLKSSILESLNPRRREILAASSAHIKSSPAIVDRAKSQVLSTFRKKFGGEI